MRSFVRSTTQTQSVVGIDTPAGATKTCCAVFGIRIEWTITGTNPPIARIQRFKTISTYLDCCHQHHDSINVSLESSCQMCLCHSPVHEWRHRRHQPPCSLCYAGKYRPSSVGCSCIRRTLPYSYRYEKGHVLDRLHVD